ncbi:unnamed protein product (mitochondrion) [Plasmodiophora brassicae]|uniref:Uncharacterized protein n=1 Tax=Plasmodiophora brassicae TaxID=37360 RepID=A0A0G4IGV8_PLABS|nr:hypothetical protein PBRA_000125 [Plasmodiophora brassicae]SPQ96689.1 unnamed protein product [Plasmodiophora brassicae]
MSGSGDDEDVATSDALLRAAAQRLSKREQSIQAQAEEIRALSDKLIERSNMINNLKASEAQLQALVKERTEQVNSLRAERAALQAANHDALLSADRLRQEADVAKKDAADRAMQVQLLQCQVNQLQDKVKEREQLVAEANLTLQAADTQIGLLEQNKAMAEREATRMQETLQDRWQEAEDARRQADHEREQVRTQVAVLQAQVAGLQSTNERLVVELRGVGHQLADQWASAQVKLQRDIDTRVASLQSRLDRVSDRHSQLCRVLKRCADRCRHLSAKLDRKRAYITELKVVLQRDLLERDKTQAAYEAALVGLDRVQREHSQLSLDHSGCEAERSQLQAALTKSGEDAEELRRQIRDLQGTVQVEKGRADMLQKHNQEITIELDLQRSLVERAQREEQAREANLRGEVALAQTVKRQLERQLKEEQSRPKMYPPFGPAKPSSATADDTDLLRVLHDNNARHAADCQAQSIWYQDLTEKMNGLITKIDQSIADKADKNLVL